MSTHVRQVSISRGALEFLHSILNTQKAADRHEVNKLRVAFDALAAERVANRKMDEEVRAQYREVREQKDAQGNDVKVQIIPGEKKAEFDAAVKAVQDQMVTISFDRNTLSYVRTVVEGIFNRQELRGGIADEDQVRLYDELITALDDSAGIKPPVEGEETGEEKPTDTAATDGVAAEQA